MKKMISLSIIVILIGAVQLISQVEEYTSLELLPDGTPTGYTNVITLNWIDPNTVEVTKSQRISSVEDESVTYDLAGLDKTFTESTCTMQLEENIWTIPFDISESPTLTASGTSTISCDCSEMFSCKLIYNPNGPETVKCKQYKCNGTCKKNPSYSSGQEFEGDLLLLRAVTVIYQ